MRIYIIIPAYNEEAHLRACLDSVFAQTLLPKKVVVVNDNSQDGTERIIDQFIEKQKILQKINRDSGTGHKPGSKVVRTFNSGLAVIDDQYDLIMKLDADIVLPGNYLEVIAGHFQKDTTLGIAGGFAYEPSDDGTWELAHSMDKDHVRGAFKTYSKSCFEAIGGLRAAIGWDTADELLARYHGYTILTDPGLRVKHLRPLGAAYPPKAARLQGQALYRMRYGWNIACIAALKIAMSQHSPKTYFSIMRGFYEAGRQSLSRIVTSEEGKFIRQFRWRRIREKLIK